MNIENEVKEAFESIGIFIENMDVNECVELDSLQFVSLIIELEYRFMIHLSSDFEDFDSLKTISDFINLINKYFE